MLNKMNTIHPFTAPVVDALTVRVLVGSRYERFLPRMAHPHVKIEHAGRILCRPESTIACEWGLSLHLASEKDGATAQYVLDFGYTPEIIHRNFELLGIEPGKINGLILSHGHLDHFGGLQGFVMQHRAQMRDDIALYVGGETVFRTKWIKEGGETMPWCTLDRAALEAQKVASVCCPTPQALEGPFTSGYIERNSFEEVTGGSLVVDDHFTEAEPCRQAGQGHPPRRTRHLLYRQGPRPGGDLLLRPHRHHQHGAQRDEGRERGQVGDGRLPPRPRARRLTAAQPART